MEEMKQNTRIKLKVNGQDGNAIFVCIDKSPTLKKHVKDYCDHHSVEDLNSVTFWFDGNQLRGDYCPAELHMNDGDEIDAIFNYPSHIRLKVSLNFKGKKENEIFLIVRRSNQLKKLMDIYCRRYWLDIDGVAFLFNGRLLQAEQTPDELQMVNGDEIDVIFYDQLAGMKLKDGNEIFFSINISTQLKKLMNAYCHHHSVGFNSIDFLFNEHRVQAEQSPDEMLMEDGDEINAIVYDKSRRINLKVTGQDGNAIFVCIDKSTQLKKLVKAYCDYYSVDLNSVTFWFDGNQLQGNHCPAELHMNDGDEIDAIFIDPSHIRLKVSLNFKGKKENEIFFIVRRSNQLKKLMDVYCRRYWLDIDGVFFLFNGCLLQAEQTPDKLQMVNGDEIDVVFYDQFARMKLKVKCQDGNEIFFSLNRNTQLKKLMNAYCDYHSVDFNSIDFLFNEHPVRAEQSPDELQMEDGDEIDAILYDKSRRINLKVTGQVGFEAFFRICRSTRLKELMDMYCRRYCFDFEQVAFLFNGRLVESDQAPDEVGMENGDEMLAVLQLRCV
ncbi:hypothetical protein P8452_73493 [Trifolium repens]|nr:hypothetical protein P8452_73493 [Trifolium repens]